MKVEITPSVLRGQVENGMKMQALAEHYSLPVVQMKRVLKELNLKIRKLHEPKYVIVEETILDSEHELEDITPLELVEDVKMEETEVETSGWN